MTINADKQLHNQPQNQHWQLAGTANSGNIVADVADIHQCIHYIVITRLGTDVLRPQFGCDYHRYIDTPEDIFKPNAVREVVLALKLWEPRIDVDSVKFEGNAPHLTMIVYWSLVSDVDKTLRTTEVAINV